MTDMDVTITVNAGETVYVMFNAQFTLSIDAVYFNGGIKIMRDNIEIPGSEREFMLDTQSGIVTWTTLTTHCIIENLEAGTYELKVQAMTQAGGAGTKAVRDGLLIV